MTNIVFYSYFFKQLNILFLAIKNIANSINTNEYVTGNYFSEFLFASIIKMPWKMNI